MHLRPGPLVALCLAGGVVAIVWTTARRPQATAAKEAEPIPTVRTERRATGSALAVARTSADTTAAADAATGRASTAKPRMPTALQYALALTDPEERARAVIPALYQWAAEDLHAAGAWARTQTAVPRAAAMSTVVNGGAGANVEETIRYVKQLVAEEPSDTEEFGAFLIVGLAQAGHHARAASCALDSAEPNIDWITSAYDRWAQAKPEAALLSATAVTDSVRRRAAADAAIGAWAKVDPRALAECAVNFPAGPEKNLAIVSALRAWAATDPQPVSEWMLAHRDAIASVPNLAVVNED